MPSMDFKSPAYAIPPPGHCSCKPILLNHLLQYRYFGAHSLQILLLSPRFECRKRGDLVCRIYRKCQGVNFSTGSLRLARHL
jgi:hypothetical protein